MLLVSYNFNNPAKYLSSSDMWIIAGKMIKNDRKETYIVIITWKKISPFTCRRVFVEVGVKHNTYIAILIRDK